MARQALTTEQKKMITNLSLKEKDKLLLRLIAKDQLLVQQLTFVHLEEGSTTDERVEELREKFRNRLGGWEGRISPGELMMQLRWASGELTRHVKVTRDKLGDVQLMIEMLHYALDQNMLAMRRKYRNGSRWDKFATYVAKKAKSVLAKADKLHPDLWLEFEAQLNDLLLMLHDAPELNTAAEKEQLPKRWDPGMA